MYKEANKTTLLDSILVPVVFKGLKGSAALNLILSNPTHALPANSAAVVQSFVGSGSSVFVYEGGNKLEYIGQYADGSGATNPDDYQIDAMVKQLKRLPSTTGGNNVTGGGLEVAAQYKFYSIFPTNISAIDLSYDSSDTIEEFTVEFQVQYWSPYTGEN